MPEQFTHVSYYRPTTESKLTIELPFTIDEDAHLNEQFVEWTLTKYPDWIPMAYLREEEDERADSSN